MMIKQGNSALTDNVLDDDFDGAKRHISTWYLVCCSCSPFIWRNGLEEVFDSGEELDRVQSLFLEILRHVSRKFPDALQNQLCNLRLLGVRWRPFRRERFDEREE